MNCPTLGKSLLLSGVLVAMSAHASADERRTIALERWSGNHPNAAAALSVWIRTNHEAADHLFYWDRDHPERADLFVSWIIEHPEQNLDDFAAAHGDWPAIDLVIRPFREPLTGFLAWGRTHPEALRDVVAKPRGLSWLGFHVYRDLWDVAHERTEAGAQ